MAWSCGTGQHHEMSAKLKEAIEGIALQKAPKPNRSRPRR